MATTTTRNSVTKSGPAKKRVPERPALRKDLQVKRRKQGTTTYCDVKIPGATSVCTLYDFELALAKKMDGSRDLKALVKEAAALSLQMDVDALGKFVRQLAAYRFIDEADPTPHLDDADEPLGLSAPVDVALALGDEEDTPTGPHLPPSAEDGRRLAAGARPLQARLAALAAALGATKLTQAVRARLGVFTSRAVPVAKRAWENTGPFRVQVVMFVHPAVRRSRIFRDQLRVRFPRVFGWLDRNERLAQAGGIAVVAVVVLAGLGLAVRAHAVHARGGSIAVAANVPGVVDRVLVEAGDRVVEGELLAVVKPAAGEARADPREVQRRLDQARSEAEAARRVSTDLKKARASVAQQKAALASAQKAQAALVKKKRVTARMRAAADRRVATANDALEKATAQVNALELAQRSRIEAADAAVASAETNLASAAERVEVRAPSAGEIVSREVAVGDSVSAEQALIVVSSATE